MLADNYELWTQHDAEQERDLEKLPECSYCGAKIQDEFMYCINDEFICEKCLNENHRKNTEDFMRE